MSRLQTQPEELHFLPKQKQQCESCELSDFAATEMLKLKEAEH